MKCGVSAMTMCFFGIKYKWYLLIHTVAIFEKLAYE